MGQIIKIGFEIAGIAVLSFILGAIIIGVLVFGEKENERKK